MDTESTMQGNSYKYQPAQVQNQISIHSLLQPSLESPPSKKRSYSEFELREEPISDVITKGVVTLERAMLFFDTYVKLLPILTISRPNKI
jgi:hypothetical protein